MIDLSGKHIAILKGGPGSERAVSLASGAGVAGLPRGARRILRTRRARGAGRPDRSGRAVGASRTGRHGRQIGRASCRERV